MPKAAVSPMQRTSSDLFFDLGVTAYQKNASDRQAADRAVEARLDRYSVGDRAQALDRAQRIFKRCVTHQGDPLAASTVWFGTVRCLERRVPEFAEARTLELIPGVDWDAAFSAGHRDHLAAASKCDTQIMERYVRAPTLGFLRSADLPTLWALGICQTHSAHDVERLHALTSHPAWQAVSDMISHLDEAFFEALKDEPAEASGSDTDASGSDTDDDDDVSAAQQAARTPSETLAEILTLLGLKNAAKRVIEAMFTTSPAARPALAAELDEAAEAAAVDYVDTVVEKNIDDVASRDLDGLHALLQDPACARVIGAPEAFMQQVLQVVGPLLRAGMQERSRKRMRDDATDCRQEGG